ncbi:MAG: hypothetical protein ACOCUU_03100, partial [Nanoarchaeota archaeon]
MIWFNHNNSYKLIIKSIIITSVLDICFPDVEELRDFAEDCEGALLTFVYASENSLRDIRLSRVEIARKHRDYLAKYRKRSRIPLGPETAEDYVFDAFDDIEGIAEHSRDLMKGYFVRGGLDYLIEEA